MLLVLLCYLYYFVTCVTWFLVLLGYLRYFVPCVTLLFVLLVLLCYLCYSVTLLLVLLLSLCYLWLLELINCGPSLRPPMRPAAYHGKGREGELRPTLTFAFISGNILFDNFLG